MLAEIAADLDAGTAGNAVLVNAHHSATTAGATLGASAAGQLNAHHSAKPRHSAAASRRAEAGGAAVEAGEAMALW